MIQMLIQLLASLLAILLLAWVARWLGLGADVRIRDEAQARLLAREADCSFAATELVLDRAGIGALLRDASGRVMLVRRHGAQFVSRQLDSHAFTRLDRNFLTVGTGEAAFGSVTLDLGGQAQVWASSLRRLGA